MLAGGMPSRDRQHFRRRLGRTYFGIEQVVLAVYLLNVLHVDVQQLEPFHRKARLSADSG